MINWLINNTGNCLSTQVEKVSVVETPKADAKDLLKEMFPNDVTTPTGIR